MVGWGQFEPGLRHAVQRLFGWPDLDGRRAAKGQTKGIHPSNAFDTQELRMLMRERDKVSGRVNSRLGCAGWLISVKWRVTG